MRKFIGVFLLACPALWCAELRVRISWGHETATAAPYYVRLASATSSLEIRDPAGYELAGE